MRRIFEIMVTLSFIFQLELYSHEDVSFNIIFLNVLEGIKQFHLSMWFKKNRLETPFKGDNIKALINTLNCEKLVLYFSQKVQIIAAFAMPFLVSVNKNCLKIFFAPPNDQKYPRYRLRAKKGPAPPLGNFADISYLEENFKPHLLRDVCTLCSGALVSDSLLHMLL